MQRLLFAGALGAVLLSTGVVQQATLEGRLASLETAESVAPAREAALRRELQTRVVELDALRGELELLRSERAATHAAEEELGRTLDARIEAVQTALADATQLLSMQDERLGSVSRQVDMLHEASASADRITALERGVEQRWTGLHQTVEATAELAQDTRAKIENRRTNATERWNRTLGPTVQLAGDTTVGSGVLLESRALGDGTFETLVLTCWHVVRDIQSDGRGADAGVPVAIYTPDGARRELVAHVLGANTTIDACLLRLASTEAVPHGAWLPSRTRLAASSVFDPIVAVGCPLGNDPIPTLGNISSMHHQVDGGRFWMISAPTYIGNSGGGIFNGGDHRLLGLFTKIYTHGSLRPVIVPHMGLVTPLSEVYDWLEAEGVAQIEELPNGGARLVPRR